MQATIYIIRRGSTQIMWNKNKLSVTNNRVEGGYFYSYHFKIKRDFQGTRERETERWRVKKGEGEMNVQTRTLSVYVITSHHIMGKSYYGEIILLHGEIIIMVKSYYFLVKLYYFMVKSYHFHIIFVSK